MQNTANFIYILFSIIGLLLTGGVWLISILLKYQKDSLESQHKAQLTDVTISGHLREQELQIKNLENEIELFKGRIQKLEGKTDYHHRILYSKFPELFKRGTDS